MWFWRKGGWYTPWVTISCLGFQVRLVFWILVWVWIYLSQSNADFSWPLTLGWSPMLEAFKVIPGTVTSCSNVLKDGNMLAISPGGVYEAQFGTEHYEVLWKKRVGFAKVAIEAQTPILPMFTQNIREAFRTVQWGRRFWHFLYSHTKLPLIPIYGFFPVKMKTIIGKPIPYDPDNTPDILAAKVSSHELNSQPQLGIEVNHFEFVYPLIRRKPMSIKTIHSFWIRLDVQCNSESHLGTPSPSWEYLESSFKSNLEYASR